MDSVVMLSGLLVLAAVIALLALGPIGLVVGSALLIAAATLGGYRLFRMVTRRTSSSHGVHRRS